MECTSSPLENTIPAGAGEDSAGEATAVEEEGVEAAAGEVCLDGGTDEGIGAGNEEAFHGKPSRGGRLGEEFESAGAEEEATRW